MQRKTATFTAFVFTFPFTISAYITPVPVNPKAISPRITGRLPSVTPFPILR